MRMRGITLVVAALTGGCGASERPVDEPPRSASAAEPAPAGGEEPAGDPCSICSLQLRDCQANDGPRCAEDDVRCRALCLALERHRDAEPGGPCPCAPGLCCQNDRCVHNELFYFSPYQLVDGIVAPEDFDTIVQGVVLRCALEGEPAAPDGRSSE